MKTCDQCPNKATRVIRHVQHCHTLDEEGNKEFEDIPYTFDTFTRCEDCLEI